MPSSVSTASVSCLNLPAGSSCSYSSSSGAVSITTSSSTPAGTYQVTVVFSETLPGAGSAAIILIPLLLLPLRNLRKKHTARGIWMTALLTLAVLAGTVFANGCGGGSSQSIQSNPTHQVSTLGAVSLTVQ